MADEDTTRSSRADSASGWRATFADPAVRAVVLYAALSLLGAITAYFTIFTRFAPYDDEGTLLVTLQAFADGDVLYRDIYSIYGPFFYEVFGGLFALTGDVTTDASRSIVVVVWVATSLLFGIAAQRLTGMLTLGLVGMATAFSALGVLASEPMHPQGLCVLLLAAFFAVLSREPTKRPIWAGVACGALLGALVMTKVNLGVFAAAAVVVAAAWTVGSPDRLRWLRLLAVAGFLVLPLVVMARDLELGWTRELMLLEVLAMTAILAAAWPLRAERKVAAPLSRWLVAAAAAFAAALLAIFGIVLLTGSTPADVYQGSIVEAMRVRDVLLTQFPFPSSALDWAISAVVAAILLTRLRSRGEAKPSLWPGTLRLAAGLAILFNVAHIVPFGLQPAAQSSVLVPMLLAWVAAVPPGGRPRSSYEDFIRVLLPAVAVAETLQVYPVAGSQVGIGSVAFVPVGALCVGDGIASLRAWAAAQGAPIAAHLRIAAPVVATAFVALFTLNTMLRPAANSAIAYGDLEPLPFAGATALRMPAAEVETYSRLVDLLHRHDCSTFIGYPNVNSLYLWSGIEPPRPAAPGAWIKALDAKRQRQVVEELRRSPRPCAVRNETLAGVWLGGTPAPDGPLVRAVREDFVTVDEVGGFEFALPKERLR